MYRFVRVDIPLCSHVFPLIAGAHSEGIPYIFPAGSAPNIAGCRSLERLRSVLDLCIVLDTTESMGWYLDQAREMIGLLGNEVTRQCEALSPMGDMDEAECRMAVSLPPKIFALAYAVFDTIF